MAIAYFQPEIWSATFLSTLEKVLVFSGLANRKYEGEIASKGDTVRITGIADPTILDYTKDTDLSAMQALTDSQQLLLIDQAKAFWFAIDDIDKRQAASGGALMTEAAQKAAYGLRDVADRFLATRIAVGASASNSLGVVDATTATNLYDLLLVPASVKLDEANVPSDGRWMVLPPAAYAKLLLDSRFIKANESGATTGLRNGFVGEAAGFMIHKSNNGAFGPRTGITATTANGAKSLTADYANTFAQSDIGLVVTGTGIGGGAKVTAVDATGTVATVDTNSTASAKVADIAITGATHTKAVVFGSSEGISYAQQLASVEALRPEARFADALKGLHLYGGKVTRPTALGAATVKLS